MKKTLLFLTLLLFLLPVFAFGDDTAATLFDSIPQLTTDELLQLRSLIDEELEQRNVTISVSPTYIVNVNSRKFHFPSCGSAKGIKEKNRMEFYGERDELIAKGYAPCKNCNP